jgi:hypothetical protein
MHLKILSRRVFQGFQRIFHDSNGSGEDKKKNSFSNMTRLGFKVVSLKNRFLGKPFLATRKFCQEWFVKDFKGHVMMQKGLEKSKKQFLEHDADWFLSGFTQNRFFGKSLMTT